MAAFSEPRDGFSDIRWSDSPALVRSRFAHRTREMPAYEGRDPRTGEQVLVGPGVAIDDFPPGLRLLLTTSVDFDPNGVREFAISAMPIPDADSWSQPDWDRHNRYAATTLGELAQRLHLENLSVELQEQSWTVDGVQIVLAIDTGPGDFMLFIKRPDR